ncbi:hypothetical protein [Streptomyces sp. NPDC057686]|uniref:hypothetical protein n=1 Tax=Streptomyces sp. NPDC057686 TaxID=3346212 RepID=UPI0036A613B4
MRSFLADLNRPAVDAFLTAVDEVMNSNTFLLKVRTQSQVTRDNRHEVLSTFLRDPLFHEMMLHADQERDWWIFHEVLWQTPDPSLVNSTGAGLWRMPRDLHLTLEPMDETAFLARLRWMLCGAFSPYRGHLDEERAEETIGAFLREVFDPDHRPASSREPQRLLHGWSFAAVKPDFLPSTEYYTGKPCPDPAYFDGGESDTATLAYRDEIFFLLLTNGSP